MPEEKKKPTVKGPSSAAIPPGDRWRNASRIYCQTERSQPQITSGSKASKLKDTETNRYSSAAAEIGTAPTVIRLFASDFARGFLFKYVEHTFLADNMTHAEWIKVADLKVGSFIFLILSAALEELGTLLSDCPNSSSVPLTAEIMAIVDKSFVDVWGNKLFNPSTPAYVGAYKKYLATLEQALAEHVALLPSGTHTPTQAEILSSGTDRLLEQLLDTTQACPFPLFCSSMVKALVDQLGGLGPVFDYFAHIVDPAYRAYGAESRAQYPRRLQDPSESLIRVLSLPVTLAINPFSDHTFTLKLLNIVNTYFAPMAPIFTLKELPEIQQSPTNTPRDFDWTAQSVLTQHCKRRLHPVWVNQTLGNPTTRDIMNCFSWACFHQPSRVAFRPDEWRMKSLPREITAIAQGIRAVVYGRRDLHEFVMTFNESIEAREALVSLHSQLSGSNRRPLRFLDFVLPVPEANRRDVQDVIPPSTRWDILEESLAEMGPLMSSMADNFAHEEAKYLLLQRWREFVRNTRDQWKTEGECGSVENPYRDNHYLPRKQTAWLKNMGERTGEPAEADNILVGAMPAEPVPDDTADEQAVERLVTLTAPLVRHRAQAPSPPPPAPPPALPPSTSPSQPGTGPSCPKKEELPAALGLDSRSAECKVEDFDGQKSGSSTNASPGHCIVANEELDVLTARGSKRSFSTAGNEPSPKRRKTFCP